MKRACLATLVALAFAGAPFAPALADDAATLTTSIQALDASAASRSPGAVSGKIAGDFQTFAGSSTNSTSLVEGLRSGSSITLTAPNQPSATFTPPTRPMGWGNVSTSLALAQHQLAQQGITSPTPLQLQTALNGGTLTANGQTVQYQGVLQMRASGMGWGEIAQASGTKLGPVISGVKTQSAAVSTLPAARHGAAPAVAPTGQGLVSANGAVITGKSAAPGQTKAAGGATDGKGIVTGNGGAAGGNGSGHGLAKGQGIVTANGGAAAGGSVNAQGAAKGQGIVTGSGVVNAGGAAAAAGGGNGLTTAGGAGAGNGKALGHTK